MPTQCLTLQMATNEDLAIAFLCLCDKKENDEVLHLIEYALKDWEDKENIERVREALRLPVSLIQRKISLLHTGLLFCPKKKMIYEEMANRLANFTSSIRSPILKARQVDRTSSIGDSRDHLMPISLYSQKNT